MSETPPISESRTTARVTGSRWPGLVWAVPIAALLIVAFLGLRAFTQQGVHAVIVFDSAAGAKVGDTKVVYRGLEVGEVSRVALARDGRRVELTVRLKPEVERLLTRGAVFWMEGAKPSLTDLSSLKGALMGVTIGMAPGQGGPPVRRFDGLDQPPPILPGTPGSEYELETDDGGSLQVGSNVIHRGLAVGKVTRVDGDQAGRVRIHIFIKTPYDGFLKPGTLFWAASPVRLSLSGDVVGATIQAAAAFGAVAFETPAEDMFQPHSAPGTAYVLYPDQTHADAGGDGPQVLYQADFGDGAGTLAVGSPVTLGGFAVGSVKSVRMALDGASGRVETPVVLALEPRRLRLAGAPANGDWRGITDAAIGRLLARGYRAQLTQSPPLVGSRVVALGRPSGAGPGKLAPGEPYPVLPTAASGDLGAIGDKAGALLDKLNAVPIEAIGQDVRKLTGRLSSLLGSPKVDQSLDRLNDTLGQVDAMVREARPKVGPLVDKLNQAADELSQAAAAGKAVLSGEGAPQDSSLPDALRQLSNAARSMRTLADTLQQHPEALIQGKKKEHP
jgi:paraquat-inducible protein B